MKQKRWIPVIWIALLALLLAGVIIVPARAAGAASTTVHHSAQPGAAAVPLNSTIYLTTPALESLFQQNIAQQAPGAFNSATSAIVAKLPAKDRQWIQQMIAALIQPSASLTGLATLKSGLDASIQIALYNGDPQPINTSMLITFQVLNGSTAQVSAQPLNGGPTLASGPLSTFQIPFGQLQSIGTTPSCGSSALALHMQVPVSFGKAQASTSVQTETVAALNQHINQQQQPARQSAANNVPASDSIYVEIPASSLAQVGGSIGTMPVSGGLTAQNIQIGVQGNNLVINSDIYDSFFGFIGTAQTTMTPTASNGNLAVTVSSTTFTILGFITFPVNSYNQQIQQTLNSKLNSAFAGKFYATQARIGPNGSIPCAAGNSLLLSGSASL